MVEKIIIASPHGFCAGVRRAIAIVEHALVKHGAPVYVLHEIVHNQAVVRDLQKKGALFVNSIDAIPEGAMVIFSAHGVSQEIRKKALNKKLRIEDAACPIVTKNHKDVVSLTKSGYNIIYIGNKNHSETEGTIGQTEENNIFVIENTGDIRMLPEFFPQKTAYLTQTTLDAVKTTGIIKKLKEKYPQIKGPSSGSLCFATTHRQNAVAAMIPKIQALIIIGSKNSSNSNRLMEIGLESKIPSFLVDSASEININWFSDIKTAGISSGASVPEYLLDEVVDYFKNLQLCTGSATSKDTSAHRVVFEHMQYCLENTTFTIPDVL